MKLIALAAALAVGGTAIAQDAPQQSTQDATQTAPATTPQDTPAPTQDTTADQSTPGTTGAGAAATDTAAGEDPRGGYMPSAPAMSGTPAPGQQVIFQPSATPSQAFPAPAPLKSYPICKRGQYDNCRQRGG